jgi:hypothetical protein
LYWFLADSAGGVAYLFTRLKFSWTEQEYTVWTAVASITNSLATFGIMPLLSYKLKFPDSVIGIIGAVTGIAASLNTAFAIKPWILYLSKFIPKMFFEITP